MKHESPSRLNDLHKITLLVTELMLELKMASFTLTRWAPKLNNKDMYFLDGETLVRKYSSRLWVV